MPKRMPAFGAPGKGDSYLVACLRASQEDLEWLQREIGRAPHTPVTVDVEEQEVRFGDRVIKATIPDGPRHQLVGGTWDSTAVGSLRDHRDHNIRGVLVEPFSPRCRAYRSLDPEQR